MTASQRAAYDERNKKTMSFRDKELQDGIRQMDAMRADKAKWASLSAEDKANFMKKYEYYEKEIRDRLNDTRSKEDKDRVKAGYYDMDDDERDIYDTKYAAAKKTQISKEKLKYT